MQTELEKEIEKNDKLLIMNSKCATLVSLIKARLGRVRNSCWLIFVNREKQEFEEWTNAL